MVMEGSCVIACGFPAMAGIALPLTSVPSSPGVGWWRIATVCESSTMMYALRL